MVIKSGKRPAPIPTGDPSLHGICRDRFYRAAAIQGLAGGIGTAAMRTLRRKGGMKTYEACGCTWVWGGDFIDAIERLSD